MKTEITTKKVNPHAPLPGTEVEFPAFERSMAEKHLDKHGREIPDPVPVAPPLGYRRSPTLAEQIRSMVISEKLKQEALDAGMETFEEADDFDVGDDYDPTSPYENDFDPPVEASPPPAKPSAAPQRAAGESPAISPPGDTKTS